jgi:mannose-6-phosphate isomerase-like protein (cupin superfamily)
MSEASGLSHALASQPLHLGLGATACAEPAFTGMDWYGPYIARHDADGAEGRLVSLHRFTADWDSWEMHPAGEEVVICIEGAMTLVQELESGELREIPLSAGDYAINPRGLWHTANVAVAAQALFITAGWGTQGRPREGRLG